MKITRSQLKSLIKEEMDRMLEFNPARLNAKMAAKAAAAASNEDSETDTVAGDAVEGAYPFEGMTVHEVAKVFEALVQGRDKSSGIEIEGLAALRRTHKLARVKARAAADDGAATGLGVAINIGHHEPVTSRDGSYTDDTDRTAWATARLDDEARTSDELKSAVAAFNSQNGGKGGQVKKGSQVHFNWTASDNVSPFPQGGPTVWL